MADRARRILQPDWPVLLRVRLTRMDSYTARKDGRFQDALVIFREVARVCAQAGDWSAEINARTIW